MRVVVDSNAMRSEQLRSYLAAKKSNRAVLIDYASIEAYKSNPLVTVPNTMEILGDFPQQVLVLRATGIIAKQSSKLPAYVRRMIWDEYTAFFPVHAASVPFLREYEAGMVRGAFWLHSKAQDVLSLFPPERLRDFHAATDGLFSVDQVAELRRGYRSAATLLQLLEMASRMAAYRLEDESIFGDHNLIEVINHFQVRHVLAKIILSIHWILDGRQTLSDERLRNDQVDAVFATYGTYFNGLMSADRRANRLHVELREVIRAVAPRGKGLILPSPYTPR